MLGLAWLGRDSSQHAGAAQIPPPRCRQGPRALGSPTRPLPAPARLCADLGDSCGSRKLAPVQVTVDGEAVRFRYPCPNASA